MPHSITGQSGGSGGESVGQDSGNLARFIVFGSFVTAKPAPNDVDIFLLMEDSFCTR